MKQILLIAIPLALATLAIELPARSHAAEDQPKSADPYVPGMGDIMGGMQVHHAKLWFAGDAKNWPLATFELAEIAETLDDVQKMHPRFEDNPMATSLAISTFASAPKRLLEKSIVAKDAVAFQESFDALTAACNTCHQNYKHDFIQITRPSKPPFTNQNFQPR